MCTSLPCSWLPPSFQSVPFAEIAQIDFSFPAQKCKCLTEPDSSSNANEVQQAKKRTLVSKPNKEDKNYFFEELSQCGGNPVILSLIAGHTEAYIPLYEAGKVMKPLTDLHSTAFSKMPYPNLEA